MSGLVEFLRARLDEDEALAREAPAGPWHIGNAVDPTQPCHVHTFPGARMVADGLNWLVAEHIARQNPARALAEVSAKRRIVDLYEMTSTSAELDPDAWLVMKETVAHLATPYADHPDYREEWKP